MPAYGRARRRGLYGQPLSLQLGGIGTDRRAMANHSEDEQTALLARIAGALERIAPPPPGPAQLSGAPAFLWRPAAGGLVPVPKPERLPLELILGADRQRDALLANTRRFAAGAPANNALLWGARGTGKSAIVKAIHGTVADAAPELKLIEIAREDVVRLGELLFAFHFL